MDDGLLNSAHVSQCCPFQEESLHTVAVQLDGLGSQVESSGVALAIEAVTPEHRNKGLKHYDKQENDSTNAHLLRIRQLLPP